MTVENRKRVAVMASGRGSNFEALCRGDTGLGEVVLLISDRKDARVLERASDLKVRSMVIDPGSYRTRMGIPEEEECARMMTEEGIDLVCLAGFMRMLKGPILEAFERRIMNIHPALLPAFPGLEAQRQALEYGVKYSGCTVHYVDAGMDTGPIILQSAVEVLDDDTVTSLSARILEREHVTYPRAVKLHCAGKLRVEGRKVRILRQGS